MTSLITTGKSTWAWENHALVPCEGLPLWDRGFRFGMSVFETIAVRGGHPLFLREHLESLKHACNTSGFGAAAEKLETLDCLLAAPGAKGPEGILRVYVTAGKGSPTDLITDPRCYLLWEPQRFDLKQSYKLQLCPTAYQPMFGGLKTANYWVNINAFSVAKDNGCDEALLFSHKGTLISASMANVFVVINGALHTPAATCGAREGIVRRWVLKVRDVQTGSFTRAHIEAADEIFLTNSRIGIMPVSQVGDRLLPSHTIATMLRKEYELCVCDTEHAQ